MIFLGCKDYHEKMIEWTDEIPFGTFLDTVKMNQPKFLEIDWQNPDTFDNNFIRYDISMIKKHYDPLKMEYFLEFEDSCFRGRFAQK